MYHYVHDDDLLPRRTEGVPAGGIRGLTTSQFAAQLDRLCSTLEPIDWPRFFGWMEYRGTIPPRSFLLTFDDGLADHARNVLPILQHRGLRGTFFVPGAVLTTRCLLSAHAIHLLFAVLGEELLDGELRVFLEEQGGAEVGRLNQGERAAAEDLYHYETPVRAHLKYLLSMKLPVALRHQVIRALFERHIGSMTRWAQHWYVSWEDLAEMQSLGHTIGGHGYSHEPYTRMSPEERRSDFHRIGSVLRNGLGPDIRPFSYPYGRFDAGTTGACRNEGFAQAFSTQAQWTDQGSDPFVLPRVDTIHLEAELESETACKRL